MNRVEIPLRLPSLNEYVSANRSNKFMGAKMKKDYQSQIGWFLKRLTPVKKPVIIHFQWVEPNKKRDLDNIAFGKKFILDSLVEQGILENDDHTHVRGFTDSFSYGGEKIIVELEEINESMDTAEDL